MSDPQDPTQAPQDGWHILLVDDEPDIHQATTLAVKRKMWRKRPFVVKSVYSAKEARDLLKDGEYRNKLQVAIVDVVMETRFAGLDLCRFIRSELPRSVRIILRTGQPGVAPEERIINDYDIDYYFAKTEATADRLYTALRACLRSSQDIETLLAFGNQLRSFTTALQKTTSREDLARFMRVGLDFLELKHSARIIFVTDIDAKDETAEAATPEYRAVEKAHELQLEMGKLHPASSLGMEHDWFVLVFTAAGEAPARGGFVVAQTRSLLHGLQSDLLLFLQNWTIAWSNCVLHLELAEERKLLEQKVDHRTKELSEAYENLEKLDQLKSQFFANVSHELRTPLTLSIGPLEELLQRGLQLSAPDREMYLRTIHANQLRLLNLINNLLDFSKLDAGRMTLAFQASDVLRSVRFYVSTLESAARTRRITILFECDVERIELYVDKDKFEKMLMNLLSNAFKFTRDGGAITVRLRELRDHVEIDVADTGIGIPTHAMTKIFERFSQVDSSEKRAYEGTGIGLAMVKEYVGLHRGEVHVQSELGVGTTFTLTLKRGTAHLDPATIVEGIAEDVEDIGAQHLVDFRTLAEDSVAEASTPPPEGDHEAGAGSSIGAGDALRGDAEALRSLLPAAPEAARILVVDDVADMRKFVTSLLSGHYRVTTAKDGMEGLETAKRIHPDVIVSDVMMPRMTGYELCEAIKRDPGPLSRTPIILLSAKADLAQKIQGLEHGADDYLFKPFNSNELLTRVRNLIRLRHQERELLATFRQLEERDDIITQDLMQARDFQQSILTAPPQLTGATVEVIYRPLDMVGGDLYDVTALSPRILRVLLADATGHGVSAALATMFIKSEYEAVKRTAEGPATVLRALNERIAGTYGLLGMRFTAVCAVVDLDRQTVRWSSAGHPPTLLLSAGKVTELEGGGPFMGIMSGIEFTEAEITMRPGDALLLYTDGITEACDAKGAAFGDDRLVSAVQASAVAGAPIGAFVSKALDVFLGPGKALQDDVSFVSIHAGDSRRSRLILDLEIPYEWERVEPTRHAVAVAISACFEANDFRDSVAMVAGELLENAMKYGKPDAAGVRLVLRCEGNHFVVRVTNGVAGPDAITALEERIAWLAGFADAGDAFKAATVEVYERPGEDGGPSRLGLVRIAHEGECQLGCDVSIPGRITVRAWCALPRASASAPA